MLLAFALIPLCGAVGLAIDGARGYLVKSRLSAALDAAGLAAARAVDTDKMQSDMERYFAANFPTGYMQAEIDGPYMTLSSDETTITVEAGATLPTTFIKILGFDDMDIGAGAEVVRGVSNVDIVFAFDLSGSMGGSAGGGQTRIEAARDAAIVLVGHIFGDVEVKENVKVGVVPWNSMVNVADLPDAFNPGSTATESVVSFINPVTNAGQSDIYRANNSSVPLLFQPPNNWSGCVLARYVDDGNDSNDGDTSYGPDSYDNKDWPAWVPVGASTDGSSGSSGSKKKKKKKKKKSSSSSTIGDDSQCLAHPITSLKNSKTQVLNAINDLLVPNGNTVIPQGLAWAWRVLMPEEPYTEADSSPIPYRAIVLLTDGQNCGTDPGDAYQGAFGACDASRSELNSRLRTIATKVKADGIKIIAIQFANDGTDLEILMQEVASGTKEPYFFNAPDAGSLLDAFESIGEHLTSIRLSR